MAANGMSLMVRFNGDLGRQLDDYVRNHEEKVIQALKDSAQLVEGTAKIKAPVDTSDLRNNIKSKVEKRQGKPTGVVSVGSSIPYRFYVHFGTGIYASNGQGRKTGWAYTGTDGIKYWTRGQKPQPFLEDALKADRAKIRNIFKNVLKGN